jgi:hypothetical protein
MYLVLVEFEPEKESKAQSLLVPVCPCRTLVLGLRFFSDQFLVFLTDEDRRGIAITGFGFFLHTKDGRPSFFDVPRFLNHHDLKPYY